MYQYFGKSEYRLIFVIDISRDEIDFLEIDVPKKNGNVDLWPCEKKQSKPLKEYLLSSTVAKNCLNMISR